MGRSDAYVIALRMLTLCALTRPLGAYFGDTKAEFIKLPGDIIIGGLFPMHEKGTGGRICGAIKEYKGIQRVEAMLYAIDKINNDPRILPNITLGVHIHDTCLRDTYALEQSLEFIMPHMRTLDASRYQCASGVLPGVSPSMPVAGVIGAAASPVSIMVANILRLFKIPQISYASTGIELSDKKRFMYFSRVVPPDTYQAQAMVDIVRRFGWKYVSTVGDEGNYGEKGVAAFESIAQKQGVCIARSIKIPREEKPDTFSNIMSELLEYSRAKIVVLFVNEDNCRRLIAASVKLNRTNSFIWLASDSWGAKVDPVYRQEWAAEGAITILPQRKVLKDFSEYFKRLTPANNRRNPWFREYWEAHFRCSLDLESGGTHCPGRESASGRNFTQEGLVPYVVDAVYTMAHALESLHWHKCRRHHRMGVCDAMKPIAGLELLHTIRDVSFTGATGHPIKFNMNGDALGRYTIYQFQKQVDSRYQYVPVGTWDDGLRNLDLDTSLLKWKGGARQHPVSVCSEPCRAGYFKSTRGQEACCWGCIKCAEYEILANERTCNACANGSYPNVNQTACVPIVVQHMTFGHPWAILLVAMSTTGILMVLFVFAVFVKYNRTPVIMASGRELCYMLQAGLLACYLMTFVMVAKPGPVTCTLLRMGLGLSLSTCYAAIFTKTNRISRIFNRGIKAMVKRPSYTSPRSQVVICLCLVSVQALIAITWVGMDFPGTVRIYPDRRTVILQCKSTNLAVALSLLYNMILIALCTVYAFKTRRIPANFNEAKYIAFTMYSTCIVWLAFIPIYFGMDKSDYRIQITALCVCVNISATAALTCLFGPRIYIVLLQPHKNVRQASKGSQSRDSTAKSGRAFFSRAMAKSYHSTNANGVTTPSASSLAVYMAVLKKDPALAATDSDCVDTSEAEADGDPDQETMRMTWEKSNNKDQDATDAEVDSDLEKETSWIIWDKSDSREPRSEL